MTKGVSFRDTKGDTLLETNIATENGWLEDVFPIVFKSSLFRGHSLVSGSVFVQTKCTHKAIQAMISNDPPIG